MLVLLFGVLWGLMAGHGQNSLPVRLDLLDPVAIVECTGQQKILATHRIADHQTDKFCLLDLDLKHVSNLSQGSNICNVFPHVVAGNDMGVCGEYDQGPSIQYENGRD